MEQINEDENFERNVGNVEENAEEFLGDDIEENAEEEDMEEAVGDIEENIDDVFEESG